MALKVAELGWRVNPGFVSRDGTKVPFNGESGNWVKAATVDEAVLRRWWSGREWLWPGVVSGPGSCLVLDVDGPVGVQYWREMVMEGGGWVPGQSLCYKTPGRGGGLHCIWDWPEWLDPGFSQSKLKVSSGGGCVGELHLRGRGHWTLLAGARRPDGGQYEVLDEPAGAARGAEASGVRAALETLLREAEVEDYGGSGGGSGGGLRELTIEQAREEAPWRDGRKNAVAGLAWYYSIRGEYEKAWDACWEFNSTLCEESLPDSVVEAKLKYAIERAERARRESEAFVSRLSGCLDFLGGSSSL